MVVMPWRRRTAPAWASVLIQVSLSLGSTGTLSASRSSAPGRIEAVGVPCAPKAAGELAAGVGLEGAMRERLALGGVCVVPSGLARR